MNKSVIKNFIIISFVSIVVTRLIPHPPNFTSTLAIAFYLPALFGTKFLIVAISAFIISDLIIGMHQLILFTWGSLLLIGLISRYFKRNYFRFLGIFFSCVIFFIVSNFGVWLFGDIYTKNFQGLLHCYTMAIPFFQNSLISSLVLSLIIEFVITLKNTKSFIKKVNPNFLL